MARGTSTDSGWTRGRGIIRRGTGAVWAGAALLLALLPATVQGAARPAAPNPGGHIVYVGASGNLYLIQADGTGKRALTNDGTPLQPYAQPTWSPAGTAILALRFARGLPTTHSTVSPGLWLVSPSGGARQLTTNVPRGFGWAPDGHTVVYEEGFPPDSTTLVQLDLRSGQKHTVYCNGAFVLMGVVGPDEHAGSTTGTRKGHKPRPPGGEQDATPTATAAALPSNRAIGVQGNQIEAVALNSGAEQALTNYGAGDGVWQNQVVPARGGRALLYSEAPGTRVIALDLRSGRSSTVGVSGVLQGLAPSPDLRWIAYSAAHPGGAIASALVRVGTGSSAVPLRAASYISPQAFAPTSVALAYTSPSDGQLSIFVASTSCPARCARRLDLGHDAAWGP